MPGKITGAVCLLIGVLFVVLLTVTDSLHHSNIEAGIGPIVEVASVFARGTVLLIGALIFFQLPATSIGTDTSTSG